MLKYRTAPVPHPYSTLSELRAYFERTTNRAAHAQFGSVRYASIQCGAVRRGTVAVIRAFQHGIDPEPDRGQRAMLAKSSDSCSDVAAIISRGKLGLGL